MKKLFILMLSLMFAMLIVSCGDDKEDPKTDETPTTDDAQTPTDDAPVADEDEPGVDETPDEDTVEPPACTLEDTLLDKIEGYDTYFAMRAIGVINDATSTARPTAAFQYKLVPVLPEHPDFKLGTPMPYYQAETNNGQELISFLALGDPGTKYYGSVAWVATPKEFLVTNKEALVATPDVDGAATVQMITLTEVDASTVMQCTVAVNDIAEDQTAPGKMKFCVADNTDFVIDENMKMAVNAKLTEDEAKLMELFGATDPAELCVCFDVNTNAQVDCPGAETPDEDAIVSDELLTDTDA